MFHLILLIVLWYGSGLASYIFWEIKMRDITLGSMCAGFAVSSFGPFVFLLGWALYRFSKADEYKPIILMKKIPSKSIDIDES